MRPFFLLLLAGVVGCVHAHGQVPMTRAVPHVVREDPQPVPVPTPPPEPKPAPIEEPEEPRLTLPAEVHGDIGTFIKIAATTNGHEVRWVALDKGLAVFPGEMLKTSTATVVTSTAGGNYRLLAYTAVGGVPSDPVQCMVVVHGPQPPPPPPPPDPPVPPKPPVPDPPVPPAPPTAQNLYIVTVDDWAARTQEIAAVLMDAPTWQGFTTQGHQWRQLNKTDPAVDAKFQVQIKANGGLPVIVIMKPDPVDKTVATWLNKDPNDLKLPATADGLRALIKKYSGR